MTKKKEQDIAEEQPLEGQKVETTETKEELDIEGQLAAAQQSAKDNWDKVLRAQAEPHGPHRDPARRRRRTERTADRGLHPCCSPQPS